MYGWENQTDVRKDHLPLENRLSKIMQCSNLDIMEWGVDRRRAENKVRTFTFFLGDAVYDSVNIFNSLKESSPNPAVEISISTVATFAFEQLFDKAEGSYLHKRA
jgi:hypothetical protein